MHKMYQSHGDSPPGMSDSQRKLTRLHLPQNLSGKQVLDVGCNEGFFCAIAAERGASRVVGLEHNRESLDVARQKYGHDSIEFLLQDWRSLPRGPFDFVLWTPAMHYEADPARVFRNIAEVLAPDGILVLECGVFEAPGKEMVLAHRHSDVRWYPTLPFLLDVLLSVFSVRRVAF